MPNCKPSNRKWRSTKDKTSAAERSAADVFDEDGALAHHHFHEVLAALGLCGHYVARERHSVDGD